MIPDRDQLFMIEFTRCRVPPTREPILVCD
jgi:hypothetical protein